MSTHPWWYGGTSKQSNPRMAAHERVVIGIDPGRQTGIAVLRDGRIVRLHTITPAEIDIVLVAHRPGMVVFEDSRADTVYPRAGQSPRGMLKIARSVGGIDRQCREIERLCETLDIPCLGVSPKRKGAKLNAKQFAEVTGWTKRSNQHTRDAAMVAWPYRRARP